MSTTDTSEKGLESLIIASLVDEAGYVQGRSSDYERDHAVDLSQLSNFLHATQPKSAEALELGRDNPKRMQFLHRLQGEISRHGVIDVLRKGVKHGPVSVDLFYGTPTPGNIKAEERFAANIFSVTRQLRYSKDETRLALDLCIFINGLPDDFLSVLSLLTGPDQEFIQRINYRQTSSGKEVPMPAAEVAQQTRRWIHDQEIDETQWREWASSVLIGWAPAEKLNVSYRLH
jgi:hypothetical protein